MVERIIEASLRNKVLVSLITLIVTLLGVWSTYNIRLDAVPDLSDVQVIVVTEYAGQNPEVVEKQVTYPLTTALLSVPGATAVRGYSMFELSFVYVLFDDTTDIYWARSRVLESLNVARGRLPKDIDPKLGPDATGVGWVYQYVLYPGYYSPDHPNGLWLDEEHTKWFARKEDAPTERRKALKRIRGWEREGNDPLTSTALLSSDQDLASLRSLQDWYLRYPLSAVKGVSEVAALGGFVKQYQVVLDPVKLQGYGVSIKDVMMAIQRSNNDVGGSVVERAENELMVRSRGYLQGLEELGKVVVGPRDPATGNERGVPIFLRDVATLQIGGEMRRGVADLNGEGEAVGGVVISRFGENAYQVIQDAKEKLFDLEEGLPPGVFIKSTYDRSLLIERSVDTLKGAVIEELVVTAFIILLFLAHLPSTLIAVFVLPIGLLVSIGIMQLLGINANIMSLGGLALAISVMVDSANVMIENAHKHLEREREKRLERDSSGEGSLSNEERISIIRDACVEVGPSIFFSLLVITVAFLPIFVLGDQSGRLFKPLAYTKTFAIAAGAILGVTIVPVLMTYFIRGKIPKEEDNWVNRISVMAYDPAFRLVMAHPVLTLVITLLLGVSTLYPLQRLGTEFMPQLEEGDLLYMPTTDPSVSVLKSKELLQQTDKIISSFPEVHTVHGKIGRADTATDPAPLSMVETVVQLHTDKAKWRKREIEYFFSSWPPLLKLPFTLFFPEQRPITMEELKYGWRDATGTLHPGLNQAVSFPGLANAWPYPIENRINMLSTGIKTPIGIKFLGPDLSVLSELAERAAGVIAGIEGTLSSYPERTMGGYYLDFHIDREAAARYGLTTGDIQEVIQLAIGGMNVTTTVEGLARYPVNIRYAPELRDNIPALERTLVTTPAGAHIPLAQLLKKTNGHAIKVNAGPPMIRSENGELTAWVFVDVDTSKRDIGGYVEDARRVIANALTIPAGYHVVWSGRFEYMQKANARLKVVLPITFSLIVFLLYIANKSWFRVTVILLAVPFSLIGAFWFMYLLGYNLSLATAVGIIALLGVDAETGQVMLLYLDSAFDKMKGEGRMNTIEDLWIAIHEGAVKRIRPKTMTVATDMIGLLPLLWATGTGADVTRRLVAPLIGGITVSFLMELLVYPVVFYLYKSREVGGAAPESA